MSDHEIVWTFRRDSVECRVVCHASPDADCRLESPDPECYCESMHIERDERGPFHMIEGYRHDMRASDASECNAALFLNDDPFFLPESAASKPQFEIGRTPIEPVWESDHVLWKPVEVAP